MESMQDGFFHPETSDIALLNQDITNKQKNHTNSEIFKSQSLTVNFDMETKSADSVM